MIYNTEMQAKPTVDLIRRTRFYQAMIDTSLLEPGSLDYNRMNDVYIIMICPFDLFGDNRYCYTFRNICVENPKISLTDGATRIILNTKGKNDDETNNELIDFLHYIETTDAKMAEQSGSDRILKIHKHVVAIKASEEIGVKYMQRWEEEKYAHEEGFAEGLEQGIEQGIEQGKEQGIELAKLRFVTGMRDSGLSEELIEQVLVQSQV